MIRVSPVGVAEVELKEAACALLPTPCKNAQRLGLIANLGFTFWTNRFHSLNSGMLSGITASEMERLEHSKRDEPLDRQLANSIESL